MLRNHTARFILLALTTIYATTELLKFDFHQTSSALFVLRFPALQIARLAEKPRVS